MAIVSIEDLSGSADLDLGDASELMLFGPKGIKAKTHDFISQFEDHLNSPDLKFKRAELDLTFTVPKIPVGDIECLRVQTTEAASLSMLGPKDSPLLGDDLNLKIPINTGECALCFEFTAEVDVGASAKLPNGFGVSVSDGTTITFDSYTLFNANAAAATTFRDAVGQTLSNFSLMAGGPQVRKQAVGTVNTWDVAGCITVGGSWSLPISVNPSALAEVKIPITVSVEPSSSVKLQGAVKLTGAYSIRSWKQSDSSLMLGVYKKKGTEFVASFSSEIGLAAGPDGTDLIGPVLSAVAPGIDSSVLGDQADTVAKTLKECVDNSLSISLNGSCSASIADQAALVYQVDISVQDDAVDRALEAALAGDWRPMAKLPKAREVENAVSITDDRKAKLVINLLGVYNYESAEEFVKQSLAIHSPEDNSLTLTDKATAKRITLAGTPYRADPNRLRQVLAESNICTAAYSFAQKENTYAVGLKQDLLIYKQQMDQPTVRRKLKAASAVTLIRDEQIQSATAASEYRHVLIHVTQSFAPDVARDLFFADPKRRTARDVTELRALARAILSSLLDPENKMDQQRIAALGDGWSDDREPPPGPLRTDYLDVVWWADAMHNVGVPLAAVLDAFSKIAPGQDASMDQEFTKKRKALVSALEDVANKTHSAFEDGWAMGLMYSLSRGQSTALLTAAWNGATRFDVKREQAAVAQVSGSGSGT